MEIILLSVKCQSPLVSLQDPAVLSKTFEEHLKHLQRVLPLLQDSGVPIRQKISS